MTKNVVKNFRDIPKAGYVYLTLPLAGVNEETGEEANQSITYKVRGGTPIETNMVLSIVALPDTPEPPTKKRQAAPLDMGGKLDASTLGMKEDYLDYDDPTYKQELEIYTDEMRLAEQRALMYRLMQCVQGFDMTDDEIKEVLEQDAHPKEPVGELVLRLDQLSEIILPEFDNSHFLELVKKITELSGVKTEQINFT